MKDVTEALARIKRGCDELIVEEEMLRKLKTGRALEYLYAGDDKRKLCSLFLSIMDRMGVRLEKFGDADTRLAGL